MSNSPKECGSSFEGEEEYILERAHGTYHLERDGMVEEILKTHWWPGIKKSVSKFNKRCSTCERQTKSVWKTPLMPVVSSRPMER